MKKTFFAAFAVLLLLPFVSSRSAEVKAQTLIDSMVTSNINLRRREYVYKSRSHWRGKKVVRKKAKKRAIRARKLHRASLIENTIVPRLKLDADLPKRSLIV